MGARRRRPPVRPRRAAADGGLPDEKRARPAHQPGEARLLGGEARARRRDSAAAGRGSGTAARRSQAGSAAARDAGAASRRTRAAPRAMRASIRSAWCSKATARSARSARRIWPAGRSMRRRDFPGGGEGDGFEGVRNYIREHRQNDFVDNLCRKLLAYALGRSLMLSDEPADRGDARQACRQRLSVRYADREHRHEPAIPEPGAGPESAACRKVNNMRELEQSSIPRRTFLRGVGVTMALPWLESLPVWGARDATAAPARVPEALRRACSWATASTAITGGPRARATR